MRLYNCLAFNLLLFVADRGVVVAFGSVILGFTTDGNCT